MKCGNVVVSVVNYFGERAVEALADTLLQSPVVSEIRVCDNSGTFGGERDRVVVSRIGNVGYGAGHNHNLLRLGGTSAEWALIINPDVMLPAEAVERLLQRGREGVVLVAPNLTDDDGRAVAGQRISWLTGRGVASRRFHYVSGACILVRVSAFAEAGGFDERYFLYYEDADLCLRLRRRYGQRSIIVSDVPAVHVGNVWTWEKEMYSLASRFLFAETHVSLAYAVYLLGACAAGAALRRRPVGPVVRAFLSRRSGGRVTFGKVV